MNGKHAVLTSSQGPAGNTLVVSPLELSRLLVLRYLVAWSDFGQVSLRAFDLYEFDDWLAANAGQSLDSLEPSDEMDPILDMTLEQPLPSLSWYAPGFFAPGTGYLEPPDPSQQYSSLFRELPPPTSSVAYWLSTAMAGQTRVAFLRLVVQQ